jgi:hypothetical protein
MPIEVSNTDRLGISKVFDSQGNVIEKVQRVCDALNFNPTDLVVK